MKIKPDYPLVSDETVLRKLMADGYTIETWARPLKGPYRANLKKWTPDGSCAAYSIDSKLLRPMIRAGKLVEVPFKKVKGAKPPAWRKYILK